MLVAGVDLPGSAVALLASRLEHAGHHELAEHVGFAVDKNQATLPLGVYQRQVILRTLAGCPPELRALRDALSRAA